MCSPPRKQYCLSLMRVCSHPLLLRREWSIEEWFGVGARLADLTSTKPFHPKA